MSIAQLLALEPGAQERFLALGLGYTESLGSPAFRAAAARCYPSGTVGPDDVLAFAGGEEPIFSFMNVALEAGDHLIVHTPAYQSHVEVARAIGAQVSAWPAREAHGWLPDPDALEALVTPRTRALVITVPHNPTGALFPRALLERCVAFCRRHGLWLLGDEVYRGLEQEPSARLPGVCELYERGVSVGALAKAYGLAGLRIGWVACRDRALRSRLAAFKDYLTICNPGPSEFLATLALGHAEALSARARAQIDENIVHFEGFLARHPRLLSWVRPQAATTAFPRLLGGGATAWARALLEAQGVLLLPGPLFDFPDTHLRLGLGRADFAQGLAALEHFVAVAQPGP
jgi:aspartate/methionine/tyrosine aminotransferase